MKKQTDELLKLLNQTNDIKKYLEFEQENFTTSDLSQLLTELMLEKNITTSECIRQSGLDRTYCYQIFGGTKRPSRDKLLAICFAMQLTTVEVQGLLKAAGYPILYPRIQRDSIILFALEHYYPLIEVNECLFDMEYDLLE